MFEDDDEDDFVDPTTLPIYQKGEEILEITQKLVQLIPNDNEELLSVGQMMMADAMNLTVKIAGAEGGDLYDLRMEAAAIIRKSARDLVLQTHSLRSFGFKEVYYFDLLRESVEDYRILFAEWVKSFDPWNYMIDRWGLFNPPGVNYDDEDPDDSIG